MELVSKEVGTTINQQPKVAMDEANSLPDPGALQSDCKASAAAPGSALPLRMPSPSMEVVPRAKRRVFSNADKRRILAAADRCTLPSRSAWRVEVGPLGAEAEKGAPYRVAAWGANEARGLRSWLPPGRGSVPDVA